MQIKIIRENFKYNHDFAQNYGNNHGPNQNYKNNHELEIFALTLITYPTLDEAHRQVPIKSGLSVSKPAPRLMSLSPSPLCVGHEFNSSEALKQACREFAVQNNFEYDTKKSSKSIYTIVCKSTNCPWRLYASAVRGTSSFRIKTFNSEHSCYGINHPGNKQANAAFVGAQVAEKLKDQPKYKPSDIVNDMKLKYGVEVTYSKAFWAKEHASKILHRTLEDAYKALPKYCQDLESVNPNTTAVVERTSENKSQLLFICHGTSATGFTHCHPLLGLDGTHLKNKYCGILLAATATDANGQLFPLAYAVVDAENNSNWLWFLHLLHTIVESHASVFLLQPKRLVILSDRQKGLLDGVDSVFPNSAHGYCMKHLEENFHKQFKNVELKKLLWKAARATNKADYDAALADMTKINSKSVPWLMAHAGPEHWAELYFPGRRYGHLTSNIAESLNSAILPACEMPILAILESIRKMLMDWFSMRPKSEANTSGLIVQKVATCIQDLVNNRARRYRF